jgi:hypothetical protein
MAKRSGWRCSSRSVGLALQPEASIAITNSGAVGVGALTGFTGTAGATEATGTASLITQVTTSYTSPSNTSVTVHEDLQPGTTIDALCYRQGQSLNGTSVWFMIAKDGERSYVNRAAIQPLGDVPAC